MRCLAISIAVFALFLYGCQVAMCNASQQKECTPSQVRNWMLENQGENLRHLEIQTDPGAVKQIKMVIGNYQNVINITKSVERRRGVSKKDIDKAISDLEYSKWTHEKSLEKYPYVMGGNPKWYDRQWIARYSRAIDWLKKLEVGN